MFVEKFVDNDVIGFERVLRDIEKILLLMQTEINYVQHVFQISLQFIVGQWSDLFAMLSTLPPKSVLL